MGYKIENALNILSNIAKRTKEDKNITARRKRLSELSSAFKQLQHAIYVEHPMERGGAKPTPTEVRAKLMQQGWLEITGDLALIDRLNSLGSKSVLRRWKSKWNYAAQRYEQISLAPRWAVAVGRYAPDRLREAYNAKKLKRDALTFQLEAQHLKK
jgi:hypothetical protein